MYRLLTICSRALRKGALRTRSVMTVDNNTVDRITDRITIGDWFFLMQGGARDSKVTNCNSLPSTAMYRRRGVW